jgi:TPR repeat protein
MVQGLFLGSSPALLSAYLASSGSLGLQSQASTDPEPPRRNNDGNMASTREVQLSDLQIAGRAISSGGDLGTLLDGVESRRCTFYREGMSDTSSSDTSSSSNSQSKKVEPDPQFSRSTSLDEFQSRSAADESFDATESSWPTESLGTAESSRLAESVLSSASDLLFGVKINAKGVRCARKGDVSGAVAHWKLAAEHYGNSCACFNLGVCAENGRVLTKDDQVAADWYSKAVAKDHMGAMYNLYQTSGRLHAADPNYARPMELLKTSALGGIAMARNEYAAIMFDQNQKEAFELFKLAADQRLPCAMFNAAVCYERGWGVDSDYVAAAELYRSAALAGHAEAMHNYALFIEKEYGGLCSDLVAAGEHIVWYRKASELGIHESTVRLQALDVAVETQEQNVQGNQEDLIESQGAVAAGVSDSDGSKPAGVPTTLFYDLPEAESIYGVDD